MLYEKPDDLTSAEKEILLLKAAYEAINSIASYMVFDIRGADPDSQIWFKSEIHQRYFIILLTDFLGLRAFEDRKKDFFEQLLIICDEPVFNPSSANLKKVFLISLIGLMPMLSLNTMVKSEKCGFLQ